MMNIRKTYLVFTRKQRSGIFFLLILIVAFQCIYFFVDLTPEHHTNQEDWIAFQQKTDSLKQIEAENRKPKIYPFNPNYITDHKGYTLGMSTAEIDRLLVYRDSGKFVNSAREFQQVTGVSDSLLKEIQPRFKFPEWITSRKKTAKAKPKVSHPSSTNKSLPVTKKDINTVTAEELKVIRGIGNVLSERIIKFRKRLGGFLIDEQVYDVYGLKTEVANTILERYTVLKPPQIQKININTATVKELAAIAYIRYKDAYAILNYMESKGKIESFEELTEIPDFPIEKIDRIKLYLEIE